MPARTASELLREHSIRERESASRGHERPRHERRAEAHACIVKKAKVPGIPEDGARQPFAGAQRAPSCMTEDDDTFEAIELMRMNELLHERPEEVLEFIEHEALLKLGEFEERDVRIRAAFGSLPFLVVGRDGFDEDWENEWRDHLRSSARHRQHEPTQDRSIGWNSHSTVEAYSLRIRHAAAPGRRGLLRPILHRYRSGFCPPAVFALPAVQAVIQFKWSSWARSWMLLSLAFFLVWLACYSAFSLLFMAEPLAASLPALAESPLGFLTLLLSSISMLCMLVFLYIDLCALRATGWQWCTFWNILDMSSYIVQGAIWGLHLARIGLAEDWFSCMLAANHIILWMKLHYFARTFNPTKTMFVDTLQSVVADLRWFLIFLALTMAGFGMAFYCLYRHDRSFAEFSNLWHSLETMFEFLVAMFDHNTFYQSSNPAMSVTLFTIYTFVVNIVLVNLLIAIMTNTYSKVTENEGLRFLINKADLIDELELSLPMWLTQADWFPEYLHVLKVHPNSQYEVSLDNIWTGMGLLEQKLYGSTEELHSRVAALEESVTELHGKLDMLISALMARPSDDAPVILDDH